jgi:hypothetical protein
VLPEAAELAEIPGELLAPDTLPSLWDGDRVRVSTIVEYFSGKTVIQVNKGAFDEPFQIPRAEARVVNQSIEQAVTAGKAWFVSGPASLLGEQLPAGVLTPSAELRRPPLSVPAPAILPENLPAAWQGQATTALAIATALSQKEGVTLPWKTVREAISGALQARFIVLSADSGLWPCDFPAAQVVRIAVAAAPPSPTEPVPSSQVRVASADFEPSQLQDLGEVMPALLEVKAKAKLPMKFHVRLELGDGKAVPSDTAVEKVNAVLRTVDERFQVN